MNLPPLDQGDWITYPALLYGQKDGVVFGHLSMRQLDHVVIFTADADQACVHDGKLVLIGSIDEGLA